MENLTAAQQDDLIKARSAYESAKARGETDEQAKQAARQAVDENRERRGEEYIQALGAPRAVGLDA